MFRRNKDITRRSLFRETFFGGLEQQLCKFYYPRSLLPASARKSVTGHAFGSGFLTLGDSRNSAAFAAIATIVHYRKSLEGAYAGVAENCVFCANRTRLPVQTEIFHLGLRTIGVTRAFGEIRVARACRQAVACKVDADDDLAARARQFCALVLIYLDTLTCFSTVEIGKESLLGDYLFYLTGAGP